MAYTTIDDPSEYFQTTLYTGNRSSSQTITNDGNSDLKPDWLWIKPRNDTVLHSHSLFDSTRGVTKGLASNLNEAEYTTSSKVTSFNTDGFSIGNGASVNQPDRDVNYVTWQWKANGGTTASNTDGTITSTVQANTDAGFNIVTYTGTGSNATVGHGLGAVPDMVIVKRRNDADNWGVQLANALGNTNALRLNLTDAYGGSDGALWWNDTSPTSTTVSIGTRSEVNTNTSTYIMYCFRSIKGYSRIGKYTGIGSDNGTFVYTGFKPAWVMIKRTNAVGAWEIYDTKRAKISGSNQMENTDLQADATGAEGASTIGNGLDLLSNGFRPTTGTLYLNGAGSTYIYLAFAEHPFVSSEGTPTTAR
jgi:hypothetical protein